FITELSRPSITGTRPLYFKNIQLNDGSITRKAYYTTRVLHGKLKTTGKLLHDAVLNVTQRAYYTTCYLHDVLITRRAYYTTCLLHDERITRRPWLTAKR